MAKNPAAGEELNKGVEAYKSGNYDEAIADFKKALDLNPDQPQVKMYLGAALSQNVLPGLQTTENLATAQRAVDLMLDVLKKDPHDVNAMRLVAGVYFEVQKLDEATEWQKKVLGEDATDADAAYTIGVIDWTEAHQNALRALTAEGLNDDGKGNTKAPAKVMETIKAQNSALVEEALAYLKQAIANRPNYTDAMLYLSLVYRRKADLDWADDRARSMSGIDSGDQQDHFIGVRLFLQCNSWERVFALTT